MPDYVLDTKKSQELTFTTVANMPGTMAAHKVYRFTTTGACWIKQDAAANTPVASAGAGSTLINAGQEALLDGSFGDTLSVVQDSTGGKASLTPVVFTR
jgi:hypothetical protein